MLAEPRGSATHKQCLEEKNEFGDTSSYGGFRLTKFGFLKASLSQGCDNPKSYFAY